MLAGGERKAPVQFRGLEQFDSVGEIDGVGWCIAGARPYALEFANSADVICLLLGDIVSKSKFEDDREQPLRFVGESAAFHPRGGNVRVDAGLVQHGFIAFSYSERVKDHIADGAHAAAPEHGSRNNIRQTAIRSLARYARERLRSADPIRPMELQFLASMVYLETTRALDGAEATRRPALSDAEFRAICDYVDAEIANEITCAALASSVNLPLRTVFSGLRSRTGLSPYQFVLDRRIEHARQLLEHSQLPIAEIAFACGFSSQQHMTTTFTRRLGLPPARLRRAS